MKEIEIKIAAFIANKNVKTRCGVPHEVLSFQKDGNGNVSALVGTVTLPAVEGGEPVKSPMLWTGNGNAMSSHPMLYDLVEELSIDEMGK